MPAAGSNLRFEIPVANISLVENNKTFKNLPCNFPRIELYILSIGYHVLAQVSVLDVLHRNVRAGPILIPAKELHEEILTLVSPCQFHASQVVPELNGNVHQPL